MRATVHLAGRCITAQGRFRRQRCEWCGFALIEDDLARMATIASDGAPAEPIQWEPGTWIRVTEGNPMAFVSLGELEKMPDDSCMGHDVEAADPKARQPLVFPGRAVRS